MYRVLMQSRRRFDPPRQYDDQHLQAQLQARSRPLPSWFPARLWGVRYHPWHVQWQGQSQVHVYSSAPLQDNQPRGVMVSSWCHSSTKVVNVWCTRGLHGTGRMQIRCAQWFSVFKQSEGNSKNPSHCVLIWHRFRPETSRPSCPNFG